MREIKILITALTMFFSQGLLHSQKDTLPLFKLSSISFVFGLSVNQSQSANQQDFIQLAPQNKIVGMNLSGYNSGNNGITYMGNGYGSFFLGIRRLNKKTGQFYTKRENRIGLRFFSESLLSTGYYKTSSFHHDSLLMGNQFYTDVKVDSTKGVNYSVDRSKVFLDIGTIFESNPDKLFRVYAGYNIGLGMSLATSVYAARFQYWDVLSQGKIVNSDFTSPNSEITVIHNSFLGTVFLNSGINLRLAQTKKFWSRCVLNLEAKAGVSTEKIEGYGMYTQLYISTHFGIKVLL